MYLKERISIHWEIAWRYLFPVSLSGVKLHVSSPPRTHGILTDYMLLISSRLEYEETKLTAFPICYDFSLNFYPAHDIVLIETLISYYKSWSTYLGLFLQLNKQDQIVCTLNWGLGHMHLGLRVRQLIMGVRKLRVVIKVYSKLQTLKVPAYNFLSHLYFFCLILLLKNVK